MSVFALITATFPQYADAGEAVQHRLVSPDGRVAVTFRLEKSAGAEGAAFFSVLVPAGE